MLATFSCEKQESALPLADNATNTIVNTRNDDHPVLPPGSTAIFTIFSCQELTEFAQIEDCSTSCFTEYKACERRARANLIKIWFESDCDAWVPDVTPFLTDQMVHIPVMIGEDDVITTIPHPSIPDFNSIYYNSTINDCEFLAIPFGEAFMGACSACEEAYADCCP